MMYQRQTEHLTRLIIANSEFLTMKFIRQGDMQNMACLSLQKLTDWCVPQDCSNKNIDVSGNFV